MAFEIYVILTFLNPNNLSNQFKTILENKIVKATLIVNEKYLYIRDNELEMAEGKAINLTFLKIPFF